MSKAAANTIPNSTIQTNRSLDAQFKSGDAMSKELTAQPSQLTNKATSALSVKAEFPSHHPVKLCLIGSAFSGKKSLAQSIKGKYGETITVFDMNEVIREALNYVDPSKQNNEPVDPKAKKPKDEPVDAFAGKDTKKYKEIAEALLKQINITTGSEGIPAATVDLVDLITDEDALCNLFGQKLKLTYAESAPNPEEQDAKRRDKIAKEKDLLE